MDTDPGSQQFEQYEAKIVAYDDAPDECTIYPYNVDESARATTWVSAKAGSFYSISEIQ